MKKLKQLLKRLAVALLARADALVTKALMKLVPRGNPTLQSIVSTFSVASAQLAELEKRNNEAHVNLLAAQDQIAKQAAAVREEAVKASRIAARLNDLVS